VIGFAKPFLFEIRYFAGSAPLLLVLIARAATGWVRKGAVTVAVGLVLALGMGVAAADQQFNGSNPRVYDFEGAVGKVNAIARPGDVLIYTPAYLDDVVTYYHPHTPARPLDNGLPKKQPKRVFLFGSLGRVTTRAAAMRTAHAKFGRTYHLTGRLRRPQINVWIFEKQAAPKTKHSKKNKGAKR
jgi:hypothetical protein